MKLSLHATRYTSIENPTLAHFRHFSSLFTKFPSTSVENSLQINPFYAKQTQFPKKSNEHKYISQKDYENKSDWTFGQNKPNSKPIKPNFKKAKMNVNSLITKDYRKKDDFAIQKNKPNSKPISSKAKMNANAFSQKDYENKTAFRPQKNKAKQTQFFPNFKNLSSQFC